MLIGSPAPVLSWNRARANSLKCVISRLAGVSKHSMDDSKNVFCVTSLILVISHDLVLVYK